VPLMFRGNTYHAYARPEIELLLCCARTRLDPRRRQQIEALVSDGLDWPYVLRTATAHGVLPLFYHAVQAVCPGSVPKTVAVPLQEYFRHHTQRNLSMTRELLTILQLLEQNGIPTLPFKGPVLAASVYGDVSLRTFRDLDVLIAKRQVLIAKKLLISHGYLLQTGVSDAAIADMCQSPDFKDITFEDRRGTVRLELHWAFESSQLFKLDIERLWGRLKLAYLGNTIVRNLPAEELLLVLCVHGAKHLFSRLQWVCDIAELIRTNEQMDWGAVIELSARLGARRMLLWALFLASDLLGTDLPAVIWKGIKNEPQIDLLTGHAHRSLFGTSESTSEFLVRTTYLINLKERVRDRWRLRFYIYPRYLLVVLKPNAHDRGIVSLPRILSFVYYFLRPIRLFALYGPIVFNQIRNWVRF
jgi:Uncharacterised nucleotidyltransferase